MKSNTFWRAVCITGIPLLAAAGTVLAQSPAITQFSGVINDYSPATTGTPMGPWEMRGPWTLTLNTGSGTADFSATLTMELSDYTRSSANIDATSGTTARMQHTHHIAIEAGTVTQIPTGGFSVTGPVTITKDGSPAPLAASTLNCQHHRRNQCRVFQHHTAVRRWRHGSFRIAIDPWCSGQPRSGRPSGIGSDSGHYNGCCDPAEFDHE